MDTGSPYLPKYAKGPPLGGMAHEGCGPIFSRVTPIFFNPCGVGGVCMESLHAGSHMEAGGCTASGDQIFSRNSPLFSACERLSEHLDSSGSSCSNLPPSFPYFYRGNECGGLGLYNPCGKICKGFPLFYACEFL